jgi:signal transduction histidine kinase
MLVIDNYIMDIIWQIVFFALIIIAVLCIWLILFQKRVVSKAVKKFIQGDFNFRLKSNILVGSSCVKEINALGEKLSAFFAFLSTEQDKAKRNSDKFQAVLSVLENSIIAINSEYKILFLNPQAEKLLNIPAEKALGLSVSEVFLLYDGETELPTHIFCPAENTAEKSLQTNKLITYSKPNLILRTPGNRTREKVVSIMTGQLCQNPSSDPQDINYIFIFKDVTLDNRLERLKSDFVTVAAHQLRTPLSAVKWALKMVIDGDMGQVNSEQKSILMKSYESNERMIILVNDMLDAEKLESSTAEYNLVPTRIKDIVDNLLLEHQPQAQKKGIVIKVRGFDSKSIPLIKLDQDKIRAVLQNLFENSIKYTPPGGMITISIEHKDNIIEVSVADTGIGIPFAEKDHMFSRFYRGTNAIKAHADGTGLGLFISKRILEDHGGKIWFESSEGKGTIFHFTLPV